MYFFNETFWKYAGQDDMQMCELKLDETGLTRRRGAAILEYEFEKEWYKNNGPIYRQKADPVPT